MPSSTFFAAAHLEQPGDSNNVIFLEADDRDIRNKTANNANNFADSRIFELNPIINYLIEGV